MQSASRYLLRFLATLGAVSFTSPAFTGPPAYATEKLQTTHVEAARAVLDPGCHLPDSAALSRIVQLRGDNGGHASSVVIRPNLLLTVAHALAGEERVYAEIDGILQLVTPLVINETRDLALLAVDTRELQPIPISDRPLLDNERVWAIGFPLGRAQRTSHGVVTERADGSLYTTAHINQGTSGGGLLRCADGQANKYELAGIVRAYIADISSDEPINTGDSVAVGKAAIIDILDIAERSRFSLATNHSQVEFH
ncbi:MAG: serine protease [Pseudomonadales bacterium]